MNIQTHETNAIELETGLFFTIQRTKGQLFIVSFDTSEELESYIEQVCVSMGEDGVKDNFIYQSVYDREVRK